MRYQIISHEFIDKIPNVIEERRIYISISFAIAIHKCCCGCGNEVVTPISPSDWELSYNGETISLYPSIGNWNFPCQSHYWIKDNHIRWARRWSKKEINQGRESDDLARREYFDASNNAHDVGEVAISKKSAAEKIRRWLNLSL